MDEIGRIPKSVRLSRAEFIRIAIRRMNWNTATRLRAERLAEISRRVRQESMRVNAEFATIDRDPDA